MGQRPFTGRAVVLDRKPLTDERQLRERAFRPSPRGSGARPGSPMSGRPDGVLRHLVVEGSSLRSYPERLWWSSVPWGGRNGRERCPSATITSVIGDTRDRWNQDPALPPRASGCVMRRSTTPTDSMPGSAIEVAFNDFGFEPEPIDREALKAGPLRNEQNGLLIVEVVADGTPIGTVSWHEVRYGPNPEIRRAQLRHRAHRRRARTRLRHGCAGPPRRVPVQPDDDQSTRSRHRRREHPRAAVAGEGRIPARGHRSVAASIVPTPITTWSSTRGPAATRDSQAGTVRPTIPW